MKTKKYILKPGRHQFAPGSHGVHHNDNLSDAEAEWYIEKYPHIASLFEIQNHDDNSITKSVTSANTVDETIPIISETPTHENLFTTN